MVFIVPFKASPINTGQITEGWLVPGSQSVPPAMLLTLPRGPYSFSGKCAFIRAPISRLLAAHLQQAVRAAFLQEGLAGLVLPGVSAGNLELQLPQLLHVDGQVPPNSNQPLQVIQTWVMLAVLCTAK